MSIGRSAPPELTYPTSPQGLHGNSAATSIRHARFTFWALYLCSPRRRFGYFATTDSISYLDIGDGVLPSPNWHRLINGVWNPLYPLLLGMVRRVLPIPMPNKIVAAHWMNLGFFLFA